MSVTEDDEPDLLTTDPFDEQSNHIRSWLDNMPEFYRIHIEKWQQLKFVEEELRIVEQQSDTTRTSLLHSKKIWSRHYSN
jgi:hypothetical protein